MTKLFIVRLNGKGEADPISIQLYLDDQGLAERRGTTFGVQGSLAPNSKSIYPFVFFTNGTIDFGTGYEGMSDRYVSANFYDERSVKVGELFTVSTDDDSATVYEVISVTPVSQ